jgi:hypothetical protein
LFPLLVLISLAAGTAAYAQSVKQAESTSGRPSTYSIRKNFLELRKAAIERDLMIAERCISDARKNLLDIQGNRDRVASTDLVNCGRALAQLLRTTKQLGRDGERLAFEARAQAQIVEGLLKLRSARAEKYESEE